MIDASSYLHWSCPWVLSPCCLSSAYLATAAHMQEPHWCCWMQNKGFYMTTMQKSITQGKQLLRRLGEWWALSLQLQSSADILFSDKMILTGPEMLSGSVSGGFPFKAFSETQPTLNGGENSQVRDRQRTEAKTAHKNTQGPVRQKRTRELLVWLTHQEQPTKLGHHCKCPLWLQRLPIQLWKSKCCHSSTHPSCHPSIPSMFIKDFYLLCAEGIPTTSIL